MDAMVVLGLLVALAVAAPRGGCDSRNAARSKEQDFASYGISWKDLRAAGAAARDRSA
jgi:hypothetical protein